MTNSITSPEKLAEALNLIVEDCSKRLLKGVTIKNLERHILGLGLTEELSSKILKKAINSANDYSHYKI